MNFDTVTDSVAPDLAILRTKLLQHPLYDAVQSADNLRIFMREHVFAVWDFMSLLKRLQQLVTCCEVPWSPPADATVCRFINEIVLGEECDDDGQGGYASHFELYLQAMEEIRSDTRPIRNFMAELQSGVPLEWAMESAAILPTTRNFTRSTMKLALGAQPHEVAAAFFYGREDLIPGMFSRLVSSLPRDGVPVGRLVHYLNRHIELDSNEHGPLAQQLVETLCQDDPTKQCETTAIAIRSIQARIQLWDGVLQAIQQNGRRI